MPEVRDQILEDLLAKTTLKDRTAFETLYKRSNGKLFGITLRILKERMIAEEALQEVYIKIWHNAHRYQSDKGRAITWMARIARNHAIDRLRARPPLRTGLDEAMDVVEPGPDPEKKAIIADQNQTLNKCLEELEPSHTNAIRLAYFDGYTYQQIAEQIAVPQNTIKTWMRRALIKLNECMSR